MVPFGSSGVLARMLNRLHIPYHFFDADVFGSFHVHGKQYRSRGLLGVLKFLGPRQSFWFVRLGYLVFFRKLPAQERSLPFDVWLGRHINLARNPQLVAFFRSISRFALSLELNQVSTDEVIKTTKNMLRYGAPGIVKGGCGALTAALERRLLEQGVEIRLRHDVMQVFSQDERVTGVRVRDKASGEETVIAAPLIVSDIGPRATDALLHNQQVKQSDVLKKKEPVGTRSTVSKHVATQSVAPENPEPVGPRFSVPENVEKENVDIQDIQEAIGLKVHILSDVSLIPHKGIMYCLDTQRIAGMVQPTNSEPRLAPAGKHLLISHQVIQSNNIEEEKALALADLRAMFGETFDKHCRVLTMGAYRGEWPVNRMVQGEDVAPQAAVEGLYLVGDAVKPSGYLMVEGVAQSVNSFLDLFDAVEQGKVEAASDVPRKRRIHRQRNVISPPSRLNALRWLYKPPGNS